MGEIPAAQSPMDKIGDLPDGRTLYYAGDRFTEPGFYIGDPEGDPVNQRVELIPARGTPAGEVQPIGAADITIARPAIEEDPDQFAKLVLIRTEVAPANGRDHWLIRVDAAPVVEAAPLTVKIVVSGAPFEVGGVYGEQPASDLITAGLEAAGIPRRGNTIWELRTEDGAKIDAAEQISEAGIKGGATLFLSPEAGGGGES